MESFYVPLHVDETMAETNNKTSVWSKLNVILWKNFTIRKHHWILTLCEITIPIVLFVLIAYVRSKADIMGKHYITTPTYNIERSEQSFYNDYFKGDSRIYYTPKSKFTEDLIHQVQKKLSINSEAVKSFDSDTDLIIHYEKFARNETVMGIVFHNVNGDEIPKELNYAIRPFEKYVDWDTESLFSRTFQYIPDSGSSNYIFKGFIAMKMALDTSFIQMVSNNEALPTLTMQEFPYPPYVSDAGATDMFLTVLPLVTLFSFVLLCPAVLKRIVEEKSTGIKELMKMMGLKSWMLWLGWFLHAFIVNIVSVAIITLVMKVPLFAGTQYAPIEYCDASLFLMFLLLYCCASIVFCFAISSLFNKPNLAMIVGIFAWILSNSIPGNWIKQSPGMKWCYKMLLALFPNTALELGYQAISIYEIREVGANWGNLFKSPSGGNDDVTMGHVLIMFIIDAILYMLITVYIENVKPGPYGIAKPLHFPFSYLYNKIKKTNGRIDDENEEVASKEYCKVEDASNLKAGIRIKNLYKRYGKQAAVNGLSFDIYEGQITALLGHNGAGKTTTMSIITGMIGATNGKVFIDNKDIQTNMDEVRTSLGLCPQHNLQFADLTVLEHLIFFAMLKGLSKAEAEEEAENLLKRMNIYTKQHSLASTLSGGMRRKLSLGIALIGNSKVLILDEPTSGLDPEARREIWDMLLSLRGSRTILITTHFMEEADVLGDRIAIMDHGRLICYGTSMYLKNEYGTGYHLTIIRDEEKYRAQERVEGRNQTDDITRVVQEQIKNAHLKANSANHLTYLLPHETKPYFSELLLQLENQKVQLGITNISMSVTTLEEVFLRVGDMVTRNDGKNKVGFNRINSIESGSTITSTNSMHSHSSTGCRPEPHLKLQLWSLLKKRFFVTQKKKFIFLAHMAVAIIITILTLYMGEGITDPSSETYKTFDFNLNKYGETSVFYAGSSSDPTLREMQRYYDKLVVDQRGNPEKVDSVSDAVIKQGIKNIAYYESHIVASAEFNQSENGDKYVNAMYSNKAEHGAPISLNLIMNSILKTIMGDQYSIKSSNHPLPMLIGNSLEEASEIQIAILWFIWFPLGMLFLAGAFLIFPHMERISNIKQLQLMCGVRSVWYWLICYIFDFILYLVVVLAVLMCILIYGFVRSDNIFSGASEIGALFVILFAYGLCVIPYSYIFSYKKTSGGALSSFLTISMFASSVLTIVVMVMEFSQDDYYEKVGDGLKHFLLLFPQFGLTYSSVQFSRKAVWNHNWDIKPEASKKTICLIEPNPCCYGLNTSQCIKYRSYFAGKNSLEVNILEMAASSVIYFAILLFLETTFASKIWNWLVMSIYDKLHPKKDVLDGKLDKDDVLNEMKRVSNTLEREKKQGDNVKNPRHSQEGGDEDDGYLNSTGFDTEEDLLLVHNLEKVYWGQKVVKGVSFGVKSGDCFGLLGVNGAGKTTTFRMLTGDEPVLTGDARILGPTKHLVHISKDAKKYLENVGYCPQFDAINEVLTGREMLTLFAELRGITSGVSNEVNYWIEALGLKEYADKPCGEYSGGNKRKLSMALALIGNPLLVMLDEPTSGVDPVSRRKLWDTLTAIQKQEQKPSVLLTSHSMEECEALCNKLAIMKAGQLECYGTIPELKQKYGQGFTVMLKLKPTELTVTVVSLTPEATTTNKVLTSIQSQSAGKRASPPAADMGDSEEIKSLMTEFQEKYRGFCTLRDKHSGLLHYHISDKSKRWSELFKEIETIKSHHPIVEDYSISETTLEEVFLSIARSE